METFQSTLSARLTRLHRICTVLATIMQIACDREFNTLFTLSLLASIVLVKESVIQRDVMHCKSLI